MFLRVDVWLRWLTTLFPSHWAFPQMSGTSSALPSSVRVVNHRADLSHDARVSFLTSKCGKNTLFPKVTFYWLAWKLLLYFLIGLILDFLHLHFKTRVCFQSGTTVKFPSKELRPLPLICRLLSGPWDIFQSNESFYKPGSRGHFEPRNVCALSAHRAGSCLLVQNLTVAGKTLSDVSGWSQVVKCRNDRVEGSVKELVWSAKRLSKVT